MSLTSMLSRRSDALRDIAGRLFQRAEIAAERELLRVVQVLVVEHQHAELIHAGGDAGNIGLR